MECGYDRLAELQEEILWLCEAAHTPVIWATQVLEGLAKTGQPSRAEITDAVVGERAERTTDALHEALEKFARARKGQAVGRKALLDPGRALAFSCNSQ